MESFNQRGLNTFHNKLVNAASQSFRNQHRDPGRLSPHCVNETHHPQPKHSLHHNLPLLPLSGELIRRDSPEHWNEQFILHMRDWNWQRNERIWHLWFSVCLAFTPEEPDVFFSECRCSHHSFSTNTDTSNLPPLWTRWMKQNTCRNLVF